jgi:hypothetical protein
LEAFGATKDAKEATKWLDRSPSGPENERTLRLLRIVCVSALAACAAGCGGDNNEPDATAGTTQSAAGVAVLPSVSGPPAKLEPGRYRTGDGFRPRITFTLPVGWYGSQGSEGLGIGKGLDTVVEDFEEVGIFVHLVNLTVAQATSRFEKLQPLVIESAKRSQLGGASGRKYIVSIPGEHVILEPLGVFADIPGGDAEVTFLNVRGETLMISLQRWNSDAARVEGDRVVQSFTFPH